MRLTLDAVSVEFSGRVVVDCVDLELGRPEFVALLGPSGSGKSTLLNVIAGIQAVAGGRRLVVDPDGRRTVTVGWIFQSCPVLTHRSAFDNVVLGGLLAGADVHRARQSAHDLMTRFGVAHVADVPARQLSGGERQRVAVCRALVPSPDILLADEPTASLDLHNRALVRDALVEAARTVPVVMATHDPAMAEAADRRVVLTDGRVT